MRALRKGSRYLVSKVPEGTSELPVGIGDSSSGLEIAARYRRRPLINGLIQADSPFGGDRRSLFKPSQQPGRAYIFNGTTDRVVFGSHAIFNWGSGSGWCGGWFAGSVLPASYSTLVMNGSGGAGNTRRYAIQFNSSGHALASIDSNSSPAATVSYETNMLDGNWHHVVLVRDNANSRLRLYLDGVEAGWLSIIGYGNIDDTDYSRGVVIGATSSANAVGDQQYFNGKVHDLRIGIAGEILTPDEVREWYLLGPLGLLNRSFALRVTAEDQHPSLALDSGVSKLHGLKVSIDPELFHYEGPDVPFSSENERGFTPARHFVPGGNKPFTAYAPSDASGSLECEFTYEGVSSRLILAGNTSITRCYLGVHSGRLAAGLGETNWLTIVGTTLLAQGKKYKARLEWADGDYSLLLDGIEEANGSYAGAVSSDLIRIGGDVTATYDYSGLICNVRLNDGEYVYTLNESSGSFAENTGTAVGGNLTGVSNTIVRIPADTAETDALGGELAYQGRSPIDAVAVGAWGFHFLGSGQHIKLHDHLGDPRVALPVADGISFDGWVIPDVITGGLGLGSYRLWTFGNDASSTSFGLAFDQGQIKVLGLAGGTLCQYSGPEVEVGLPVHVVMFGNSSGSKLYVNGRLVWTGSAIAYATGGAQAIVGAQAGGSSRFYAGVATRFSWYRGELSALEVEQLYKGLLDPVDVESAIPVWKIPFSEGEGSPISYEVITGTPLTHIGSDTSVGGTAWVRQDEHHENLNHGFQRLLTADGSQASPLGVLLDNVSVDVDAIHAFDFYFYTPVAITDVSASQCPFYFGPDLSTQGQYVAFGSVSMVVTGERFCIVSGSSRRTALASDIPPGWHRIACVWNTTTSRYEVFLDNVLVPTVSGTHGHAYLFGSSQSGAISQFGVGSNFDSAAKVNGMILGRVRAYNQPQIATSTFGTDPDGLSQYMPVLEYEGFSSGAAKAVKFRCSELRTTGDAFIQLVSGFTAVSVTGGVTASHGFDSLSNPGGVLHNGAESVVDWTGYVDFPQPELAVNEITLGGDIKLSISGGYTIVSPASSLNVPDVPDPFGGTNTYRFKESGGAARQSIYRPYTWAGNTFSVYAKAHQRTQLWIDLDASTGSEAVFDLDAGTVLSDYQNAYIQPVGNGWYRCSISGNSGTYIVFGPAKDGNPTYLGDNVSGVYIAYAMMEPGIRVPSAFSPWGAGNVLDMDYEFGDTPANPHFQRYVSDGNANIIKTDRRVHYKNFVLGPAFEKLWLEVADPQGLLVDNFNRPGRLNISENFDVVNKPFTLSGGYLTPTAVAFNFAIHRTPLKTSSQYAEILARSFSAASPIAGVALCFNDAMTQGYLFGVKNQASLTYRIFHWNGSAVTMIGQSISSTPPTAPYKVSATIQNGVMKGYVNGEEVIERDVASVVDYTANRRVGFYGDSPSLTLDDFRAMDL